MPTRAAATAAKKAPTEAKPAPVRQVPASPPIMVEVRLGGRIKFAQECYSPELAMDTEAGTVTLTASLQPVLIDTRLPPREAFSTNPRDGMSVILQAHSGRRDEP